MIVRKLMILFVALCLIPLFHSCSSTGSSARVSYGVGAGYYRYGYQPWYPCGVGCRPPAIDRPRPTLPYEPTPELPYEPPIFEATPLPSMDFDMDFGVWD